MILKIRLWCEGIAIAIIMCIIIESLIPNSNNKKYIKVVIGIYIMFITLNPILELLNYDFNLENFFNLKYEETYSSIDSEIKDIYIVGIEETIKQEIMNLGYEVKSLKLFVDINYENIEKIELQVVPQNNAIKIENIEIGYNQNTKVFHDILIFFETNYSLKKEQIYFK